MQITATGKRERIVVDAPPLSPVVTLGEVTTSVSGRITVSVHHDLAEIEQLWREFEHSGICSVYQRFDWVNRWMSSAGKAQNASPYIIIGRVGGKPMFLYPFARFCRGPFCVVNWIGGSHSNFNLGIYDPGFIKNVRLDDMRAIFSHVVKYAEGVDAFELCCQPMSWQGHNNPLNFLKRLASPNHAFSMQLAPTFDEVLAEHNAKKKRKKYRSQMRAMEALDGPNLIRAETEEDITRLLDAALEQIKIRLDRMGVINVFEEEGIRSLFLELSNSSIGEAEPSLVIYGLEVDGKIRATFAGGGHQGRFSGCFTSIAMDELANTSPGDLLLYLVIEDCVKRGYSSFDLGRGEERYKSSWCNEIVPMFESFIPVSKRAIALTVYDHIKVTVKRMIKQNPKLWQFTKQLRARLRKT